MHLFESIKRSLLVHLHNNRHSFHDILGIHYHLDKTTLHICIYFSQHPILNEVYNEVYINSWWSHSCNCQIYTQHNLLFHQRNNLGKRYNWMYLIFHRFYITYHKHCRVLSYYHKLQGKQRHHCPYPEWHIHDTFDHNLYLWSNILSLNYTNTN